MAVMAVILLVTLGIGSGITLIEYNADMESFLPEDNEALIASNVLADELGAQTYENILIKGDVTSLEGITAIRSLQAQIMADPELDGVATSAISYIDMLVSSGSLPPEINDQTPLYVQQILSADKAADERQIVGILVSEGLDATIVMVQIEEAADESATRSAIEHLRAIVADFSGAENSLSAGMSGDYTTMYDTMDSMGSDNVILISAAALFIIFVLIFFFRTVSDMLFPFLTIVVSLIWILGIMGFAGIPFTVILVALVPLLLGISINYAIHVIYRYKEERMKGETVYESIAMCVKNTGTAVFLSAITTVFGFSSFFISDLMPMRHFGVLAVMGIIFAFILVVTLLPALMVIRDRSGKRKPKKVFETGISAILDRLVGITIHHKRPVLLAALAVTVCSLAVSPLVDTTMNWEDVTPKGIESVDIGMEMAELFENPYTNRIAVLVEGDVYSPETMGEVMALGQQLRGISAINDSGEPIIESAYSVSSYVDYISQANGGQLPQTSEEAKAIAMGLVSNPDTAAIMGQYLIFNSDSARVDRLGMIYVSANVETERDMEKAAEAVTAIVDTGSQAQYRPAGAIIIMADIMGGMASTQIMTTLLALILCLIVVAIILKSVPIGALAVLPVFLTISWEFLLLYAIGWAFDLFTIMISALIVGLGIDFSVHIIHRFKEEVSEGKGTEDAIHAVVTNVGKTLITATITTGGAFFILGLSSMPILARFGILTGVVLVFSFAASMFVLPPLLAWLNDRSAGKSGA